MTIISDASLQGWGATCNGNWTRGPWFPSEQSLHINCLELLAATLAVQIFAKAKLGISILLQIDNSTGVAYINRRGDSITKVVSANKGPMVMVHGGEHPPSSPAPTRSPEHKCRRGVQNLVKQVQVEAFSNPIPENQSLAGSTVHRPVCKQALITTPSICELEARPSGTGHRRLYSGLEHPSRETVCQPTLEPRRQSPIPSILSRSTGADTYSLSLESSSLVSSAPSNAGQSTTSHSSVTRYSSASVPEHSTRHHPTVSRWVISGNNVNTFLNQLQISFSHLGGTNPQDHTTPLLENGLAGVVNGIEIPFQAL